MEGDIGFVVVCGKYRTGKSFMLNKLLNTSGDGVKKNLNNLVQSWCFNWFMHIRYLDVHKTYCES